MHLFLDAVLAGLAIGSIYGLVGIGFTVILHATRVFNLAQGDLVMVAVMLSFYVLDDLKYPQLADLALVVGGVVILALLEERVVVRYFLQKSGSAGFGWFIATLGFSAAVETVVSVLFGHHPIVAIPSPFPTTGFRVWSLVVGYRQLFVILMFVAIIVALHFFFGRTWMGKAMRGTAEDRDAASLLGINPVTVSRAGFAIAGLLAGLAGYAIAPLTFSDPTIGLTYTLNGFLALAIGGFGSIPGAITGGLALGIGIQLWDLYIGSKYDILTGIILLMIVLIFRPEGMFRTTAARTV